MNFSHFVRTDWLYRTNLEQNTAKLDNEYTCGRLNRLTAHYFGYWLLAIGLVMRLCRYLYLYTLRHTLYALH